MTASNAILVKALDAAGHLESERLRAAFTAVDRADFVPDRIWHGGDRDEGRDDIALDRAADPAGWEESVYDPHLPIVTQWDDGAINWPETGVRPTSSCSAPSVVATMLAALDVDSGSNVLEIGTGTGYNAALLAQLAGRSGDVTTVEIDPSIALTARERLITTGYEHRDGAGLSNVRALVRDGASSLQTSRPWDRVMATAAVPAGRIPYAWIEQSRPGAVVVVPICTDLMTGPLVRLVVGDDGVATGTAVPGVSVGFMKLRGERGGAARLNAVAWEQGPSRRTDVDLIAPFKHPSWLLAIGLGLRNCRYDRWPPGERGPYELLVIQDPMTLAWASVHGPDPGGAFDVRQHGPRRLADELRATLRWFAAHCTGDEPPPWSAWRWELGPDRQTVTLPAMDGDGS